MATFLSPRLVGSRFEGGAIPLEFLKDLAVLEEMIVEVAKSEFLKDHPERQRSPRGFTQGIQLKLTDIQDGSAIPVISLIVAATSLFPPDNQIYLERARDAIIQTIGAAEQNRGIIDHLPEKTLGYFDRLGRSLKEEEAIEFDRTSGVPARLTKETRRRLLLASPKIAELTEETIVRGAVPEADQDNMTFELQLVDGRRVKAPIATQHLDAILEAFNGYKDGLRVMIQGVGRFNRTESLLRFDSVEHVSMLDSLDIASRLDELRVLKDGWLEGIGSAPSPSGIDWLLKVFDLYYPDEAPLPHLYPTETGGIRAEWTVGDSEASLDIDLDNHFGEWHQFDIKSDVEEVLSLTLDQEQGWKQLVRQINLIGG